MIIFVIESNSESFSFGQDVTKEEDHVKRKYHYLDSVPGIPGGLSFDSVQIQVRNHC
jgi:hypothetical protein